VPAKRFTDATQNGSNEEVTATLPITGNELCFDPVQQKVYVLQTSDNAIAEEPEEQPAPRMEKTLVAKTVRNLNK